MSEIEGNKLVNVKKTFNLDGLIIELLQNDDSGCTNNKIRQESSLEISLESENNTAETNCETFEITAEESQLICVLCFELIDNDNVVILTKCQDVFCRPCITNAIIQSNDDVMPCPLVDQCDNNVPEKEKRRILGDENFELLQINIVEKKLQSLESLYEEF